MTVNVKLDEFALRKMTLGELGHVKDESDAKVDE